MLAEEDDGDGRAEDRDQVKEGTGAVGADQLDAAVEEDVGDERREDHDVGENGKGREGRIDPAAGHVFGRGDRRQHDGAGDEGEGQERQEVDRRAPAQERGVERVAHHGDQEPDVAGIELEVRQRQRIPMGDDHKHAHERNQDADELGERQAVAEEDQRPQADHQRRRGLHQRAVEGGGVFQPVIGERVVDGDAGKGEQQHDAEVAADRRPVLTEFLARQGHCDQRGADPADLGECRRRDRAGDEAPEHDVDRPEQRGQRQEQIGPVEQGAAGERRCGHG